MNTFVSGTSGECAQLEAYIRALDDAARQPLQAVQQDRIKGQRKGARDRQFARRCQ